ncbi:MAG: hypothetical protein Q8L14_12425 [Myxococcales bacterium]|nr:hypothetical protein [Myxococcales bacterium]
MKRASLLVLVFASGCFDFQRRVDDCFDGGRCVQPSDGGADGGAEADAGLFVPLDAGFFCASEWCWESPFPHGTKLNAVAAFGDDVLVAGEEGMLAEFQAGVWRSVQEQTPRVQWARLWGRSFDDAYAAGAFQPWVRSDGGWRGVGQPADQPYDAVTGDETRTFFGNAGSITRFDGQQHVGHAVLDSALGDVTDLTMARGRLFAVSVTSQPASFFVDVDAGVATTVDRVRSLFATDAGFWVTGETSFFSPATPIAFEQMMPALRAGTAGLVPLGATVDSVGVLDGGRFTFEYRVSGVTAMAQDGTSAWAVGEGGLVLRRRGGTWTDLTGLPTRSTVQAIFPYGDSLVAVTGAGELLERRASAWEVKSRQALAVVDAVRDGSQFVVLSEDGRVVWFDAQFRQTQMRTLNQGTEAYRLWRSPSGTIVATSNAGAFFKRPAETAFTPIAGVGRARGVSGRGEIARLCGVGVAESTVVDVDLSAPSPTATVLSGLEARECRAILALPDGWAIGGRAAAGEAFVTLIRDGVAPTTVAFAREQTWPSAFALTPGGLAVALNGIGLIPLSSPPPTLDVTESRIGNSLFALTVWKGRLFAGGGDGAIVQRALPQ